MMFISMENEEPSDSPFEFIEEAQISDYVSCLIDVDKDVHIVDTFIEERRFVLPKEEAVEVAKFILKYYESN